MADFTVTVTQPDPSPPPPRRITLEMDEDTARALKVLTGLGLVHFNGLADTVARRNSFSSMDAVGIKLLNDRVWDRLDAAGI